MNGGKGRFKGEIELDRLVPVRCGPRGCWTRCRWWCPALLPATLSGRLEADGTPESATLTGRLHVVRARYTSDVDLQASLLRRRVAAPPRAYDRAGEWLRLDVQLVVDGDVRVENDLVRGPVSGELTLTGTLAAPGLVGSLAMGRGSKVTLPRQRVRPHPRGARLHRPLAHRDRRSTSTASRRSATTRSSSTSTAP